ncbi:MAG: manganese catalase family protein [Lachnospiraceae bacterium]|nr:manganese catalase family protein [Lachnospiraceae bacterium]
MYRKPHRIMPVPKYGKWNITAASLGTEELGHLEIVGAIVHQLTRNLTPEEIEQSGFGPYYIDHTVGVWPQAAGGVPFNACEFQSKGDPITDLFEDLAAEQKARVTYDNILRMVKDPEVCDPIRFLRKREIVHFQRFGEVLRNVQDHLNSQNFYAFNPSFDVPQGPRCQSQGQTQQASDSVQQLQKPMQQEILPYNQA